MKVKCPSCGVDMEPRTGKYGDFFYCLNHGTISKAAFKALLNAEYGPISNCVSLPNEDTLLEVVKRKGIQVGHHIDDLGQLVDWYNDNEQSAEDDDDHWMNIRPY